MPRFKTVIIFLPLFLLFFVSCNTTQENLAVVKNNLNAIMNTSAYASNVYIGVSPRMRTHESEVDAAKRHIAHQIAMRNNCIVDIKRLVIFAGRDNFILPDSFLDYDDPSMDELLEHIEEINVYEFKDLIVVVGRDSRKPGTSNIFIPRQSASRPKWVDSPESVRNLLGNEYYVGVGIAEKYSMYYRGIFFADFGAAQAIASEKKTFTYTYTINHVENRTLYLETEILTLSENVELEGFLFWIDGLNLMVLHIIHWL